MELFNPRTSLKFFGPIEIAYFIVRFVRLGDLDQPDILEPFSVCSQLSSDRPTSQLYGAATSSCKSLPSAPPSALQTPPSVRARRARQYRAIPPVPGVAVLWRPAVVAHGGGSLNADAAHIGRSCFNLLSDLINVNTLKSQLEARNALARA